MRAAHAMPFGAQATASGVRFALFAPQAREAALVLDGRLHPMPANGEGWREILLPDARAGSRYSYRIDGKLEVPDPASRFQPLDALGPSQVVDPSAYRWSDATWKGRPWEEAIVYELHIGTFTPQGTYAAASEKLAYLRDLGVTAVELMPLADFPGRRGWGYDGVHLFAPDAAYGTPDDLKRLVDRAHGQGLMVLVDVVYNHFGPSGNFLSAYAGLFFTERHRTPWGAAINFDGPGSRVVREFFIHNALYWLEEYRLDGLRLDAVHAIADDGETHVVAELAQRVRAEIPDRHIHLIVENDANTARFLARDDGQRPTLHTAQWSDDIHHCWHTLLTGEREGYYEDYADAPVEHLGRALAEGFAYQGEPSRYRGGMPRGEPSAQLPPSAFVAFLQNHDQVGNRAFGERLSTLADPRRLAMAWAALLLAPQTPMLFMGEEWAASTPFLYFVDFAGDEGLSRAVRDGRRHEFARFAAFAEPAVAACIPDPTSAETFARSILDWGEIERPGHVEILAQTRRLLALRAREIVPLTGSRFRGAARSTKDGLLRITWRFDAGTLSIAANFSDGARRIAEPPQGEVLWPGRDGAERARLGPWEAIVVKGAAS